MRHETFLPQKKKNFQFAQSTNKKQIRWRSLTFLLRGWTLLPLKDFYLENSFDWFHWPNKERIQYLRNFLVFRGEVQKVFWNTTLFCRQWFRLLSALIFKSFFSKATISWQYKCFSVDKFTKIGRKYDSCLEKKKKVVDCDYPSIPSMAIEIQSENIRLWIYWL